MFDNLYKNIGEKIKGLAILCFIMYSLSAIAVGVMLINSDMVVYGIITIALGVSFAWISSILLYAFGVLVEDVHAIRNRETISRPQVASHNKSGGYVCPECRMSMDAMIPCERCGYVPIDRQTQKTKSTLIKKP
jgi:hypothetical protein